MASIWARRSLALVSSASIIAAYLRPADPVVSYPRDFIRAAGQVLIHRLDRPMRCRIRLVLDESQDAVACGGGNMKPPATDIPRRRRRGRDSIR
jgi:hypothetical protein